MTLASKGPSNISHCWYCDWLRAIASFYSAQESVVGGRNEPNKSIAQQPRHISMAAFESDRVAVGARDGFDSWRL